MKGDGLSRFRRQAKFFFDLLAASQVRKSILQALPFWVASLLTGLVAVGFTKLFGYTEGYLQSILEWNGWMIFLMTPICFLLAWAVVQWFASNARGSGIPQVMAAIELSTPRHDEKVDKLLNLRIIVTKI